MSRSHRSRPRSGRRERRRIWRTNRTQSPSSRLTETWHRSADEAQESRRLEPTGIAQVLSRQRDEKLRMRGALGVGQPSILEPCGNKLSQIGRKLPRFSPPARESVVFASQIRCFFDSPRGYPPERSEAQDDSR